MDYEYEGDKPLFIPLYSLLLIIGICFIYIGGDGFLSTREFLSSAIATKGKVAEMLVTNDGTYKPVFQFNDQNNHVIRFEHNISSSPAAWSKDETVWIAYDPSSPTLNHKVISYWGLFRSAVIFTIIGLSLIVVSIGYFLFLRNVRHW